MTDPTLIEKLTALRDECLTQSARMHANEEEFENSYAAGMGDANALLAEKLTAILADVARLEGELGEALAALQRAGDKDERCSCGHRRESHHCWGQCHQTGCRCSRFVLHEGPAND